MSMKSLPSVRFNAQLMAEDMAERGWEIKDLVARTDDVSQRTAYRFLSGELQTVRTGKALAKALGRSLGRYLIRSSDEAVAS